MANVAPFRICGLSVAPGQRASTELPAAQLYTHTQLDIPLQVLHGRQSGPVLLITAAIHGDELNGVEILRRLLRHRALSRLRGTLLAVPVLNVFGFIHRSRYLPDRRDLNRCFPGSSKGSLGARMAHQFTEQVLARATHLLDLHTGAIHRSNLPQIRADMEDAPVAELARAFGVPVILDSAPLGGSLRQEASQRGIPAIVYEAGEALRFDEPSVRAGVQGCMRVLRHLGMLPATRREQRPWDPFVARASQWVRAEQDGVFRPHVRLGAHVARDDLLGVVGSPAGEDEISIRSPAAGVLVGRNNIPLVNEGEALFHIARFDALGAVARGLEDFRSDMLGDGPDGGEPSVEPSAF